MIKLIMADQSSESLEVSISEDSKWEGVSPIVREYLKLYNFDNRKWIEIYAIEGFSIRYDEINPGPMISETDVTKLNALKKRLIGKKFNLKTHLMVTSIGVILTFDDNHNVSICCGDSVVANTWKEDFCEVQFQGEFRNSCDSNNLECANDSNKKSTFRRRYQVNSEGIKKYHTADDLINDLELIRDEYFYNM